MEFRAIFRVPREVETNVGNLISFKLSAMDVLVRATMKDAAKCETQCELQNSVNHQISERKWRCRDIPCSMSVSVSLKFRVLSTPSWGSVPGIRVWQCDWMSWVLRSKLLLLLESRTSSQIVTAAFTRSNSVELYPGHL